MKILTNVLMFVVGLAVAGAILIIHNEEAYNVFCSHVNVCGEAK